MSKLVLLLPVIALLGCQKPAVDQAHGDREKFHFYSENLAEPARYLCAPGKGYPETKARAEAAHAQFEKKLEQHAAPMGNKGKVPPGASQPTYVATASQMQQVAQEIGDGLEAKFQCVMVED